MSALRILSCALMLLSVVPSPLAAQRGGDAAPGITGQVLAPDGSAVTQGNVTLTSSAIARDTAAIDRTGRFRIVPDGAGWQRLFISVPGYAPHRVNVNVPPSRAMALPAVTLLEATYFRARFVTSEGEPLAGSGLRRRSVDAGAASIPDPLAHVREHLDPDGSITIGPLPPGRTLLAFDRSPLAQTRLRDVTVGGVNRRMEGGTITIGPGAQLHVDIVDAGGLPVPRHQVEIEDAIQPSPLSFQAVRTNDQGLAVFERLAPGRYRVWTRTVERCGSQPLAISRLVTIAANGAPRMRFVVGGRATFRITSALGPVIGRTVSVAPDGPAQSSSQPRFTELSPRPARLPFGPAASCSGVTDADGRVVLAPLPPGPAQLRVSLFNSTYFVRVAVPEGGGEMVVAVPDGLIPVKVKDQNTQQPVQAQVMWVGAGGRSEAVTNANGDALLEGAGAAGGTLTISARDYQPVEGSFDQTPGTLQEVALVPSPSSMLRVRVVSGADEALAGAVVQLIPRSVVDVAEFSAAGANGVATFVDVPPGPLQFSAHADGYGVATVRIAEDERGSIVIALTRSQ